MGRACSFWWRHAHNNPTEWKSQRQTHVNWQWSNWWTWFFKKSLKLLLDKSWRELGTGRNSTIELPEINKKRKKKKKKKHFPSEKNTSGGTRLNRWQLRRFLARKWEKGKEEKRIENGPRPWHIPRVVRKCAICGRLPVTYWRNQSTGKFNANRTLTRVKCKWKRMKSTLTMRPDIENSTGSTWTWERALATAEAVRTRLTPTLVCSENIATCSFLLKASSGHVMTLVGRCRSRDDVGWSLPVTWSFHLAFIGRWTVTWRLRPWVDDVSAPSGSGAVSVRFWLCISLPFSSSTGDPGRVSTWWRSRTLFIGFECVTCPWWRSSIRRSLVLPVTWPRLPTSAPAGIFLLKYQ